MIQYIPNCQSKSDAAQRAGWACRFARFRSGFLAFEFAHDAQEYETLFPEDQRRTASQMVARNGGIPGGA